jgi:hypothetical protein
LGAGLTSRAIQIETIFTALAVGRTFKASLAGRTACDTGRPFQKEFDPANDTDSRGSADSAAGGTGQASPRNGQVLAGGLIAFDAAPG